MAEGALTAASTCLDDDAVVAFVEGSLPRERWDEVNLHIAGCDACRSLVSETAKFFAEPAGASVSPPTVDIGGPDRQPASQRGTLAEGQRIDRYVVGRVLGEGGMGVVYLARDVELRRKVALKVLRPESDERLEHASNRLLREAQAMARVSHPNVLPIHDVGRFEGQIFLAMEFVSRGTLLSYLSERPRQWREILELCMQAGRGLAAAHAVNLVHRDFKPANVLVGDDSRVRVTDFGLASMATGATANAWAPEPTATSMLRVSLTHTGTLLGTPAYASPEQLRGDPADARSDQFSFCVTLYEALYRRHPFADDDFASLVKSVNSEAVREPPLSTDVPRAIFDIIRRGLRVDPAQRYARMEDLLDELAATLSPSARAATPTRDRKPFVYVGLGVAAVAVALVARSLGTDSAAPVTTPAAPVTTPNASTGSASEPSVVTPPRSPDPVVAPAATAAAEDVAAAAPSPPKQRPARTSRPKQVRKPASKAKKPVKSSEPPTPPAPSTPIDDDALKPLRGSR